MLWPHKHILDIAQFKLEEINYLFSLAENFFEINSRQIKKVPVLKGKSVVLFFAEPSTRTKTSFDMAAKRLSADTFSLSASSSSLKKGETLKDTALTLRAMNPDAIVLRHSQSGASSFLSRHLDISILNAGDGWHAHPTQALLDAFSLYRHWSTFQGKTVLFIGDIAHSRVARSGIALFSLLGASIRVCAPRTLLPPDMENYPVRIFSNLNSACRDIDAVICLRLQLERQAAGLFPDFREYAQNFCLTGKHLQSANPKALLLHPGPMNRGIEIESALADSSESIILDQVASGVAMRMTLLYLLLAGPKNEMEEKNNVHHSDP
ncbi:MAG: aspartate carbamoyltransferase catalytic subunit [Thermodesulfobacteriota bacterium]